MSLFTDRAIKYREDHGFDHIKVALSAGVQMMVRSDQGSSEVIFTLDPDSGFTDVVLISSTWGLGENVVQGSVNPDEFYVFKPTLHKKKRAIISHKLGSKKKTMIYAKNGPGTVNITTPKDLQHKYSLDDNDIYQLADWAVRIEQHYHRPMDIEFAKDGITKSLYIVQARPETVYSTQKRTRKYSLSQKFMGCGR